MGIVFVLLLGEIDLSVGFVSGVAGVIVALLTLPDNRTCSPPADLVIALRRRRIGLLHGVIITKLGVPSFVVTLAGLLAGTAPSCCSSATAARSSSRTASSSASPTTSCRRATAWILAVVAIALYAAMLFLAARATRRTGLASAPDALLVSRRGSGHRRLAVASSPIRTAASRTCAHARRRLHLLDLRAQPHAVRAPHLRRRRQRRGRAARRHQRRQHQDRRASRSAR